VIVDTTLLIREAYTTTVILIIDLSPALADA
jgi:hypothetical protein